MGRKDNLTKNYMKNPEIFADFFNGLIFDGKEKWDAPTSLKEMLQEYDFKLDKYINDYNINLLSIIDLKTIPNFKTELRLLFALLNMRNDGAGMKELVSSDNRFQHISRETAELMSDFASIKLPKKQKEGDYNMCKAVLEIKNEGIAEGRAEGDLALTNAIKNLMDNMNKDFDEACNLLGINDEDRNRYKALM